MPKGKIVAVIQARMGSTRLPEKMMLHLNGYPVIEWVVRRTQSALCIHDVVVAIPDGVQDDILADYLNKRAVDVFRGSEPDVLSRIYHAAESKSATDVVRICADNPLICGSEIDHLIRHYRNHPCDYAYNHIPKHNRYPDGLGAEITPFAVLKQLMEMAVDPDHREHCFNYIVAHPGRFVIETFDPPNRFLCRPDLRFDIDTIDDYRHLTLKRIGIDATAEQIIHHFSE